MATQAKPDDVPLPALSGEPTGYVPTLEERWQYLSTFFAKSLISHYDQAIAEKSGWADLGRRAARGDQAAQTQLIDEVLAEINPATRLQDAKARIGELRAAIAEANPEQAALVLGAFAATFTPGAHHHAGHGTKPKVKGDHTQHLGNVDARPGIDWNTVTIDNPVHHDTALHHNWQPVRHPARSDRVSSTGWQNAIVPAASLLGIAQ